MLPPHPQLPTFSDTMTRGVRVQIQSFYDLNNSAPTRSMYTFSYKAGGSSGPRLFPVPGSAFRLASLPHTGSDHQQQRLGRAADQQALDHQGRGRQRPGEASGVARHG